MKKIFFAFLPLLFLRQSVCAETVVPERIKNTFTEKFPQAAQVKWSEQNGVYEADFMLQQHPFSALLDNKGTLLHSGETLNWFQFPASVRHTIGNDFQGFQMKLMMKENGTYLAEFTHKGSGYLITLDGTGKVILSNKE
ncbi:MAG: hypothetical protein JWO58_14 [Chitinophagaceae bacterium]|nr:hypothetical protein [Chitinophagaceae bacterium]